VIHESLREEVGAFIIPPPLTLRPPLEMENREGGYFIARHILG